MSKSYIIEKSLLYSLRNKRKLGEILDISPKILKSELNTFISYRRILKDTNGKQRKIDLPSLELKKAQKRLVRLLNRIEKPDYLISGVRGFSYVDNAKKHLENRYILVMDISSFYPNCKSEYVYEMFLNKFKMSADIATILTKLTTHKKTIPTGISTSQVIAYYAYIEMFDKILEISKKYGCKFSLYVDDMTFSSLTFIPKELEIEIKIVIEKYGHIVKKEKTHYYKPQFPKKITGVYLTKENTEISVPNSLRKDIIDLMKVIESKYNNKQEIEFKLFERLKGKILSAQQIEPYIFQDTKIKLEKIKKSRLELS